MTCVSFGDPVLFSVDTGYYFQGMGWVVGLLSFYLFRGWLGALCGINSRGEGHRGVFSWDLVAQIKFQGFVSRVGAHDSEENGGRDTNMESANQ